MGVDIPFMPHPTIGLSIDAVDRYDGLTEEDRRLIFPANACKLFPRLAARLGTGS